MASARLLLDEVDWLRCACRAGDRDGARKIVGRPRPRYRAGHGCSSIHALTTVLLVWDLDHKERFLRVVFMPQSKSWLARGAFILITYSGLCGVFWLAAVMGFLCRLDLVVADGAGRILRRRLYRVSLRAMRRPRPVADAAPAGAFDRSSFALRFGGASAASRRDRRFGAGVCHSRFRRWSSVWDCICSCCSVKWRCRTPPTTRATVLG